MVVNVDNKIRKLSVTQRKKVDVRAAELIATEMALRERRKTRTLAQVRLARWFDNDRNGISRPE